ncbi:MAG: L-glyceraldehyde 3-phosphate reductase [Oscillospiraceae bacterium]
MNIDTTYLAADARYDNMLYKRCGNSGLKLPALSLGFWHNFGDITPFNTQRAICRTAFDAGITHFDLANNYGPPYGEAERNFGQIYKHDFVPYRDELIISSKAGWDMWPGPYGDLGSKKYLVASMDQSLKRIGVDYFDIFYHHRPDPETPLEETLGTLDLFVRQGKALYVGISSYTAQQTKEAVAIFKRLGTPFVIHQPRYNMLDRWVEDGLLDVLSEEGVGCIAFSPLAQGVLTGKYKDGIPADSRAGHDPRYLKENDITQEKIDKANKLEKLAAARGQTLVQMSLSWLLQNPVVTSALIGVSRPAQLLENVKALDNLAFTAEELSQIDAICLA